MKYKRGVGIVIIHDGRLLLVKRRTEPFAGFWEIPAGDQGAGETLEETAVREAREETNLVVSPVRELGVNVNHEKRFESHIFLVELIDGLLENLEPEEHSKVEFFSLDALPNKLGSTTLRVLDILRRGDITPTEAGGI